MLEWQCLHRACHPPRLAQHRHELVGRKPHVARRSDLADALRIELRHEHRRAREAQVAQRGRHVHVVERVRDEERVEMELGQRRALDVEPLEGDVRVVDGVEALLQERERVGVGVDGVHVSGGSRERRVAQREPARAASDLGDAHPGTAADHAPVRLGEGGAGRLAGEVRRPAVVVVHTVLSKGRPINALQDAPPRPRGGPSRNAAGNGGLGSASAAAQGI